MLVPLSLYGRALTSDRDMPVAQDVRMHPSLGTWLKVHSTYAAQLVVGSLAWSCRQLRHCRACSPLIMIMPGRATEEMLRAQNNCVGVAVSLHSLTARCSAAN